MVDAVPIVMQKQWEVSLQYGMFATPIAYLIGEQGVLLSDVAVGVEPILALAEAVGELLGRLGVTLVSGGRGGVMEAASRGAARAGGLCVGKFSK